MKNQLSCTVPYNIVNIFWSSISRFTNLAVVFSGQMFRQLAAKRFTLIPVFHKAVKVQVFKSN